MDKQETIHLCQNITDGVAQMFCGVTFSEAKSGVPELIGYTTQKEFASCLECFEKKVELEIPLLVSLKNMTEELVRQGLMSEEDARTFVKFFREALTYWATHGLEEFEKKFDEVLGRVHKKQEPYWQIDPPKN